VEIFSFSDSFDHFYFDVFPIEAPNEEKIAEAREFLKELEDLKEGLTWVKKPTVSVGSVQRLKPEEWQSEQMINYLFQHRKILFGLPEETTSTAFFDSYFVCKLKSLVDCANKAQQDVPEDKRIHEKKLPVNFHQLEGSYKKIMGNKKIVDMDSLIFVVNETYFHWAIIVALPKCRSIEIIDSMRYTEVHREMKHALLYIWKFLDFKRQMECSPYLPQDWKAFWGRKCSPRQDDGWNCGFFALFFAMCVTQHLGTRLCQTDFHMSKKTLDICHLFDICVLNF